MKNKKRALIFCAGPEIDWPGVDVKHKALLEVGGERLIDRIVRQCLARNLGTPTVVCKPEHKEAFLDLRGAGLFEAENSLYWCNTVLSTMKLWRGQIVGLLGDTWYTDECMDVCCQAEGLHWVGRAGCSVVCDDWAPEAWAVTWHSSDRARLIKACTAALDNAKLLPKTLPSGEPTPSFMFATYWQPYRALLGLPLQCHFVLRNDPIWIEHSDLTEDMDTVEKYEQFLEVHAALTGRE